MNYSDYRFTLDVQIHQAQVSVPVTLNDTARRLYIGFTDGRKPYTIPDGCRAVFAALKPDGHTILNDCIIENNKTVIYEFSKNTTNAEGVVDCEIRLYDKDDKELTSPQFIIVVDKKVVRDEEISLSESESTTLDDIIRSEFQRIESEKERNEAEEERKELAEFLATSGGVIVSEDEPQEALGNVWVDSSSEEEDVYLLDSTDIAQELTDENDKIPSVALLKDALDKNAVRHSWDGTVLTFTSANGTSSADLKGAKGDTYVLTETDKDEIADIVLNSMERAEDWVL